MTNDTGDIKKVSSEQENILLITVEKLYRLSLKQDFELICCECGKENVCILYEDS